MVEKVDMYCYNFCKKGEKNMIFSEQLIYLRKQKGLSQEHLGEKIGVTRQTVSKWELGITTPEMDKLIELSNFFNISIDTLVGQTENKLTSQSINNIDELRICKWHYEYKSKRTFRNIPLIHINLGYGLYHAKGLIAIGTIAKGLISIGAVSIGLLSLGTISMGILSLGVISISILLSVGAISIGSIAIGGLSIGILAIGGCAIGIYSMGGCAIAFRIAAGGYANAPIAIGEKANGEIIFNIHNQIDPNRIKNTILEKYPQTWRIIVELFKNIS